MAAAGTAADGSRTVSLAPPAWEQLTPSEHTLCQRNPKAEPGTLVRAMLRSALLAHQDAGSIRLQLVKDGLFGTRLETVPLGPPPEWPRQSLEARLDLSKQRAVADVVHEWLAEDCSVPSSRGDEQLLVAGVLRGIVEVTFSRKSRKYSIQPALAGVAHGEPRRLADPELDRALDKAISDGISRRTSREVVGDHEVFRPGSDPWMAESQADRAALPLTATEQEQCFRRTDRTEMPEWGFPIFGAVGALMLWLVGVEQQFRWPVVFGGMTLTALLLYAIPPLPGLVGVQKSCGRLLYSFFGQTFPESPRRRALQALVLPGLAFFVSICWVASPALALLLVTGTIVNGALMVLRMRTAQAITERVTAKPEQRAAAIEPATVEPTAAEPVAVPTAAVPQAEREPAAATVEILTAEQLPAASAEGQSRVAAVIARPRELRALYGRLVLPMAALVTAGAAVAQYGSGQWPVFTGLLCAGTVWYWRRREHLGKTRERLEMVGRSMLAGQMAGATEGDSHERIRKQVWETQERLGSGPVEANLAPVPRMPLVLPVLGHLWMLCAAYHSNAGSGLPALALLLLIAASLTVPAGGERLLQKRNWKFVVLLGLGCWALAVRAGSAANPAVFGLFWTAIVAYLALLALYCRRLEASLPVRAPLTLLALRVFRSGSLDDFLQLTRLWRWVGTEQRLDGPDTAGSKERDLLLYATGALDKGITEDATELNTDLAGFRVEPDHDLCFPVNSIQCTDATWKAALDRLMDGCDVVLMDLSGLTPQNQGCIYELRKLAHCVPNERVLLLVNDSTDLDLLRNVVSKVWRDSPQRPAEGAAKVRALHLGGGLARKPTESVHDWRRRLERRLSGVRLTELLVDAALPQRSAVAGVRRGWTAPRRAVQLAVLAVLALAMVAC